MLSYCASCSLSIFVVFVALLCMLIVIVLLLLVVLAMQGSIQCVCKLIFHIYIAATSEGIVQSCYGIAWYQLGVWFIADIRLGPRRVAHHLPLTDQATHLNQLNHKAILRTITLNRVALHLHVSLLHSNHSPLQLAIPTARVLPTVDLHHSLATNERAELQKWKESIKLSWQGLEAVVKMVGSVCLSAVSCMVEFFDQVSLLHFHIMW